MTPDHRRQRGRAAAQRRRRGDATRPTSDRVREALFSAVESQLGSLRRRCASSTCTPAPARSASRPVAGGRRGDARRAGPAHRRAGRATTPRRSASPRSRSSPCRSPGALARPPRRRSTSCSSTRRTPCRPRRSTTASTALRDHGWLAPDALVVVERSARDRELAWPDGFEPGARTEVRRDGALVRSTPSASDDRRRTPRSPDMRRAVCPGPSTR